MEIHHAEHSALSNAERQRNENTAVRGVWVFWCRATMRTTGATMINAVALMPPTVNTSNAMSEGCNHERVRAPRELTSASQPTAAHGSNMTDVRDW